MIIKKMLSEVAISKLAEIALKHLQYSMLDVKDYSDLTGQEREMISFNDFKQLFESNPEN